MSELGGFTRVPEGDRKMRIANEQRSVLAYKNRGCDNITYLILDAGGILRLADTQYDPNECSVRFFDLDLKLTGTWKPEASTHWAMAGSKN